MTQLALSLGDVERPAHTGPTCRACRAPILWATMQPSQRRNPLDVAEVAPELRRNVVAYYPRNGHGVMLSAVHLVEIEVWLARGVTFHTSHFASCPYSLDFQRGREP